MKLLISDINERPEVAVRTEVREDAVLHYMDILDQLPPIEVVKVEDELLLTDGKHRLTAASRLGRTKIEAHVANGTLEDAIEAAAVANVKRGVPMSRDEQRTAILHLWQSDPGKSQQRRWTAKTIANAIGVASTKVQHILNAERGREGISDVANTLSDAHLEELRRVPELTREPLAKVAGGLTHRELRDVVAAIPEAAATFEADADPARIVNMALVMQQADQAAREEPMANLLAALKALGWARSTFDPSMFDAVDREERIRIDGRIEEFVLFLQKVQAAAMDQRVRQLS